MLVPNLDHDWMPLAQPLLPSPKPNPYESSLLSNPRHPTPIPNPNHRINGQASKRAVQTLMTTIYYQYCIAPVTPPIMFFYCTTVMYIA